MRRSEADTHIAELKCKVAKAEAALYIAQRTLDRIQDELLWALRVHPRTIQDCPDSRLP